jgi:hypothetical protein
MRVRTIIPLGMTATALVTSIGFSTATDRELACAPARVDIVCRIRATLRVTRYGAIRDGHPRRVKPGSTAKTSGYGAADLFLGRRAECQLLSPTNTGTEVLTRRPRPFVLTQFYGRTLCTLDDTVVLVVGRKRLSDLGTPIPIFRPFYAVLVAKGGPVQVRVSFTPQESLSVGVLRGTLRVELSNRRSTSLGREMELTVELDLDEIASIDTHKTRFVARELKTFKHQRARP